MHMIFDFMHFDTIAFGQKKNQFEKWTIIIFVQCTDFAFGLSDGKPGSKP